MVELEFVNIVQKIVDEYGKDIFLDQKKLKSLLLDYTKNEYKNECMLFLTVVDAGSVDFINRAENVDGCKRFLVKHLEDDYSLSPVKSAEMLDWLFSVLRWDISNASVNTGLPSNKPDSSRPPKDEKIALESLKLAYAYAEKKDYNNAINELNQAIQYNSSYAEAYALRGCIYADIGDYKLSISDLNQALIFDPNNVDVYQYRGKVHQVMGNKAQAIKDFDEAIKRNEKK
jgi:tetratricopeptide (TPR) repeat protein